MVGKLDRGWMMGVAGGVGWVLRDQLNTGGFMTDGGSCSARIHPEASKDGYSDHQFAPLTIHCVKHMLKESLRTVLNSEGLWILGVTLTFTICSLFIQNENGEKKKKKKNQLNTMTLKFSTAQALGKNRALNFTAVKCTHRAFIRV